MAHENLEAIPIEALAEAIERMDGDALVALCHPGVIFESRITALDDSTYRGHEGARRYIANLADAFERVQIEQADLVDEPGCAVVTSCFRARGRGSGVEVEQVYFAAAKGSGGKLLWWRYFDSRQEALEAVGLRE